MRLPCFSARGVALGAVSAVTVVAVAGAALAQVARQPEITDAPQMVGFRQTFVVEGHLQGGIEGDEVTLQRWTKPAGWKDYATDTADESLRVSFRVTKQRFSHPYRLVWQDPEGEAGISHSEHIRVGVRPLMRLAVKPGHVYQGNRVRVRGGLWPEVDWGRQVVIQERTPQGWDSVRTVTVRQGEFSTRLPADRVGRRVYRAVFRSDGHNTGARASALLRVYEPDLATWYGPGLYGNGTACGQRLVPGMLGVAHRTLPCGTKVGLMYNGRTITVRVIDRGPYSAAEWDLTEATARRLGFSGVDEVGTTR